MFRPILLAAALIAGISFYFVRDMSHGPYMVAWKGAGVALLAIWAVSRARDGRGRLLAAILACGALGDVLLETAGLTVGAVAFLIGHILAMILYLNLPRVRFGSSAAVAVSMACAVAAAAFALTHDIGATSYGLALGGMAGSALASRFDRRLVGVGAALFVISDLLIFSEPGVLHGSPVPGLLIWPTYFAGQALIAIGVVVGLRAGKGSAVPAR